jgi:mRNA interferase MazF
MKRGEIWAVSGGVYASKPRPAVIIQDDLLHALESVTVVPLTSVLVSHPILRINVGSTDLSGLAQPSQLMVDKLTTVRRSHMAIRIGALEPDELRDLERSIMVTLGLAH